MEKWKSLIPWFWFAMAFLSLAVSWVLHLGNKALADQVKGLRKKCSNLEQDVLNERQNSDVLKKIPPAQADFYQQFVALQEREKTLYAFLLNQYPTKLEIAQNRNSNLIDCARAIILEQQERLARYEERKAQ
jgi:hypothetical protein